MSITQGRVMTIRVTVQDPKAAEWIWEAHKEARHGVMVSAIANGDLFKERDMYADAAAFYIREEGESTQDAISSHAEPFSCPGDAAHEAPRNVSPGAKWDIIDVRGNVVRSSK